MRWRHKWPAYVPRPRAAKLLPKDAERIRAKAAQLVEKSSVLAELVKKVQFARGRIYFWRDERDLMARVTPLADRTFVLEAPRRSSWTEVKRGSWNAVANALERDEQGTFHGLGSLVSKDGGSVQQVLHREFGVPVAVLAEPRYWYSMHRKPRIVESDRDRGRVLVYFGSFGPNGPFGGTCLYARVDDRWGCYTIRPNASGSIATAEAWLEKRGWQAW